MKKLFYSLLIAAASLSACEKAEVSPYYGKKFPEIVIQPQGEAGTHYKYNIYTVYEPNDFNRFDTLQHPLYSISGKVGDTLHIPMTDEKFYYVIGYRDTIAHLDSFSYSQSSGSGTTVLSLIHRFIFINRHQSAGVALPATEY